MGSNSSRISDLPKNEYLKKLSGTESISENDPFWNQLFSFSFTAPTSSTELKLLEEATISVCKSLVENNPRTGNLGALTKVFLSRTRELRLSAECQNHIFIWQTHNALFIICCLLKVFICEMSEEELQLQFMYEEKSPGSYKMACKVVDEDNDGSSESRDITYDISVEAISAMVVFLSCQLFHKEVLRQSISHKYLMQGPCLPYTSKLVKTLLYNFIRQEKPPPPGTHVFPPQSDGGGLLYGLASGVATGLWTVFTLGGASSKTTASPELTSPLANQSLLLLLVLVNLTDAPDTPNPYRQAVTSFKNTQDSSPFPSSIPHAFQINFNSLYTALCEQQSDQATLLLYTLLHQNSNVRTYVLARTDMENLVLPILEILYHVEERNSHHVYMALIILLILTEDDGFNRSIHEVDKYLHTNCLAALANMSAQFRSLHQYAAQRIISLFSLLSKKHNKVLEQATQSLRGPLSSSDVPLPDYGWCPTVPNETLILMLSNSTLWYRYHLVTHLSGGGSVASCLGLRNPATVDVKLEGSDDVQLMKYCSNERDISHTPSFMQASLHHTCVPSLSLPLYQAQDLSVIEEVIRMMLEIINSCLTNSLHHNPNLVYALLYKRDLFEQFRTHPSFQDIMQNIDLFPSLVSPKSSQGSLTCGKSKDHPPPSRSSKVISFFSSRLLQAGAELSVERVLEIIKQGVVALPKDRLKKFPELKFRYVEEEQPEEFFIPYVWSLVYNSAVGLYWNPQDIQLFAMDSD
ncbi:Dymeclin [Microtus ochrogaster]|uniref:Dymeclin n=1 Tax=Microtus ochrogaster TaxID=79684 RepID=A0A8J6L5C5_MICOH|nr:Dymeclin [Microtus ochrogaster]